MAVIAAQMYPFSPRWINFLARLQSVRLVLGKLFFEFKHFKFNSLSGASNILGGDVARLVFSTSRVFPRWNVFRIFLITTNGVLSHWKTELDLSVAWALV